MGEQRLRITYQLTCADGEDPAARAREIALEQTVELPAACVPPALEQRIVGRVETIEPLGASRWQVVIAYDPLTLGDEIPQLFNLLFGNISLQHGIRVSSVAWPAPLLKGFAGPRHGVEGLRELCGVAERRPLLCAALKPMGLTSGELAGLCHDFALGGIDIIKDDHGLADQQTAPFHERVERCQEAVERANRRTGGHSLYFANLTRGHADLETALERVRSCGCKGILISPLLVGPDTVRWISQNHDLAILSHPSLAGAFLRPDHGLAHEVLLGDLFRMIGSDGVIYPNVGGRFPFTAESCDAINRHLRGPLGGLRPAFPVPGGGIDVQRVPGWIERYGPDTIFLIGGSLYAQGDLVRASVGLVESVRDAAR
jgi:ribulose-bisphosphate carboxylase large chain